MLSPDLNAPIFRRTMLKVSSHDCQLFVDWFGGEWVKKRVTIPVTIVISLVATVHFLLFFGWHRRASLEASYERHIAQPDTRPVQIVLRVGRIHA